MCYSRHLILLLLFISMIFTPVEASEKQGIDHSVRRIIKNCDKCDDTGLYIKSLKLAKLGSPAIPFLVSSLKNADAKEKLVIIQALGEMQNDQHVKIILFYLKDNDPQVRTASARALELLKGREAVVPLIKGIKAEKDTEVKCWMISALGNIGDERAVVPLIELLKGGSDEVVYSVAIALREFKDARAVKPLTDSLRDRPYYVNDEISKTLAKIGKPALKPLIKAALDNKKRNGGHIFALGYMKNPETTEVLMKIIQKSNGQFSDEESSAIYIAGKSTIPYLVKMLEAEKLKLFMVNKLKKIGILNNFIERVNMESIGRRQSIAEILGRIKDKSATFVLLDMLKNSDEDVRMKVIESLGEIGDKRAVNYLIPLLRDNDEFIRGRAADALRKLGDKSAVEPLITMMKKRKEYARDDAAYALGEIGDKRATEPLIEVLNSSTDPDWRIISALGEMKDKRALKPLLKLLEQKKNTIHVLRGLGKIKSPESFEHIVRYMEKNRDESSYGAIYALAEMNDERAIEPIVRFIKENRWTDGRKEGYHRYDFWYLGYALASFGKPALAPTLELLKDKHWQVRIIAGVALTAFDDPKAEKALMDAMKNHDLAVIAGGHNYYISKGQQEMEIPLIESLNEYGDFQLTGVLLNSKNRRLNKAATFHGRKNKFCFHCMSTLVSGSQWGKEWKAEKAE